MTEPNQARDADRLPEKALAEYRRTDPASAAANAAAARRRLPRLWPAALVAATLLSILVLRLLIPVA